MNVKLFIYMYGWTKKLTEGRATGGRADGQAGGQADGQMGRWADGQTGRRAVNGPTDELL
jgi:hypothetical protein